MKQHRHLLVVNTIDDSSCGFEDSADVVQPFGWCKSEEITLGWEIRYSEKERSIRGEPIRRARTRPPTSWRTSNCLEAYIEQLLVAFSHYVNISYYIWIRTRDFCNLFQRTYVEELQYTIWVRGCGVLISRSFCTIAHCIGFWSTVENIKIFITGKN